MKGEKSTTEDLTVYMIEGKEEPFFWYDYGFGDKIIDESITYNWSNSARLNIQVLPPAYMPDVQQWIDSALSDTGEIIRFGTFNDFKKEIRWLYIEDLFSSLAFENERRIRISARWNGVLSNTVIVNLEYYPRFMGQEIDAILESLFKSR